ncbi:sigma 54-interacting transcriptional regulator [Lachnospiraceae bacterium ZAX-1]
MEDLLYEKDLLSLVVKSFNLAVVIDEKSLCRYISSQYAIICGVDPKVAIGRPVREFIPNSELPDIVKTGRYDYRKIFFMPNGEPIIINRSPIYDDNHKIIGAMSFSLFEDLSTIDSLIKERNKLYEENSRYKLQLAAIRGKNYPLDAVIGSSLSIIKLKTIIENVASTDITVLLTGETGTGKEVISDALCALSNRKDENYVKINCASIPHDLMESELFGYTQGAFSGASKDGKPGKFEIANNGTILLDEIGDLPLPLQAKLLRVLQHKEFERVGGLAPIKVNVRVICNTNSNLSNMIKAGTFRKDLYYRISTIELPVPPLRDRIEDVPLLCNHFIEEFNLSYGFRITGISDQVINSFQHYSWPGNIRQLEHVIERASISSPTGELGYEQFAFFLEEMHDDQIAHSNNNMASGLFKERNIIERELIKSALVAADGNKTKAAYALNISRSQLYVKLKKYGIDHNMP